MYLTADMALPVDSSQLDGNSEVFIWVLSVWPSIVSLYGKSATTFVMLSSSGKDSSRSTAEPE